MLYLRAGRRGSTLERQSGSGGAGERSAQAGCISLRGISPPAESEAPGADPDNPPEQGGDGVSDGDGLAAAERRGGRSRGQSGAERGGAERSYLANRVALDPIKQQKNEAIKPTEHCAAQ